MEPDVFLVTGIAILLLSLPTFLASLVDFRFSPANLLAIMVALVLMWGAWQEKPGGYTLADIPYAVANVIGKVLN